MSALKPHKFDHKLVIEKLVHIAPVPSLGGPARGITWSLKLNDIVIHSEFCRVKWSWTPDLSPCPRDLEQLGRRIANGLKIISPNIEEVQQRTTGSEDMGDIGESNG